MRASRLSKDTLNRLKAARKGDAFFKLIRYRIWSLWTIRGDNQASGRKEKPFSALSFVPTCCAFINIRMIFTRCGKMSNMRLENLPWPTLTVYMPGRTCIYSGRTRLALQSTSTT